jgi:hypothetical protein
VFRLLRDEKIEDLFIYIGFIARRESMAHGCLAMRK